MDEQLEPKPQMVESWTLSDDRLTYTFTLRDGLEVARRQAGDGRGLHRLAQALGARIDGMGS